jgi:retron-type reverse transcriptase
MSTRQWIFEGDFKGCFDNLNHEYIMDCLTDFPAKESIYKWLKAGYVDNNSFNDTDSGTPQGSLCEVNRSNSYKSKCPYNFTLHYRKLSIRRDCLTIVSQYSPAWYGRRTWC